MSLAIRGVFWVGMYLAVAAAPLVFALVGDTPPGRDFLTDSPSPSSRVWCAG